MPSTTPIATALTRGGQETPRIGSLCVVGDPRGRVASTWLGSCVAVVVLDPEARVAGLVHGLLPDASVDPRRAASQPALFLDTGVPALVQEALAAGARLERLRVYLVGGADPIPSGRSPSDTFLLGRQNAEAARQALHRLGLPILMERTGGRANRLVTVNLAVPAVSVRTTQGGEETL
ncbi:MAG: chemotaxis protein CheD [Planctomycetes bacterium]|nr:chemotaxis protein CheD [Planctomycetota bacterium]